ncbi:hypothetical protein TNCV_2296081 [Trichonephila clavipes]|nr:hypothetical protein TNCV_2296081 [Trichonephila clavipes]
MASGYSLTQVNLSVQGGTQGDSHKVTGVARSNTVERLRGSANNDRISARLDDTSEKLRGREKSDISYQEDQPTKCLNLLQLRKLVEVRTQVGILLY